MERAQILCPDLSEFIEQLCELFMKEKAAFDEMITYQGGYFFERDRRALLKKEFRRNLSDRVTQVGKRYAEAMTYAANYPFSSGYTIPIKK